MEPIIKYPRTKHLVGSKLQPGDEDLSQVTIGEVRAQYPDCEFFIEEKIDGANSAISFDSQGTLHIQSRGHYLTGGGGERQFALLKQWANENIVELFELLEDRYIMYGEWMYAKHTIFYDALPAYFMEFDIYDRSRAEYLSTPARVKILSGSCVSSVLVVMQCEVCRFVLNSMESFIKPTAFQTGDWKQTLAKVAEAKGQVVSNVMEETDMSGLMEGLYIKVEDLEKGIVVDRLKCPWRLMPCVARGESVATASEISGKAARFSLKSPFDLKECTRHSRSIRK